MTEVIFTKDAGRFKKDRVVDFPPALADFFVSKVRCAEFRDHQVREALNVQATPVTAKVMKAEDFSDVLADAAPVHTHRKSKIKTERYGKGNAHRYSRRDMQAEG